MIVYDAPFRGQGSFQTVFNAMINDGVNVISNSWAYCEDQTTASDVQSIESILASAAAAGITVVTGAGDQGSTCLNRQREYGTRPGQRAAHHRRRRNDCDPEHRRHLRRRELVEQQSRARRRRRRFGVSRFFSPAVLSERRERSVPCAAFPMSPRRLIRINGFFICQQSAGGCPTPFYVWAAPASPRRPGPRSSRS